LRPARATAAALAATALAAALLAAGCAEAPVRPVGTAPPPVREAPVARTATASPAPRPAIARASVEADPRPLSLGEVLASINGTHPTLEAVRADVDAAVAERLAAEGGFDPVLRARATEVLEGYYDNSRLDIAIEQPTPLYGATIFGGYRLGDGEFAVYDGKQETESGGEVRVGASIPLLRNGVTDRRRASIRRSELAEPIARLSVDEQRLVLARLAANRYWDWVAAGRRYEVARRLLAIAVERDAVVGARVQAGDLPDIERTENARAIAQRRGILVAAGRALEQAAIELSLFLRRPDGTPVEPRQSRLPGAFPEPAPVTSAGPSQDAARALVRRPEMRRFEALREQAWVDRRLASNQVLPAVDVQFFASQDLGTGRKDLDTTEVEASVMVEVPFFQRTARGNLEKADAGLAKLEAQARAARDRVLAEVRDARSALEAARQRIAAARAEVGLAQDLVAVERARFDLGDGTLLLVNLREQAAVEAEARVIDALADWHKARAAWDASQGDLDTLMASAL